MSTDKQFLSRIWKPLFDKFSASVERACLRRDVYLDHVFAHEANVLKDELPRPNSPKARVYLQSKLEELERVPVNFSLSPSTIKAVNQACEQLNVIRDCFINRVLFLLVANQVRIESVIGIEITKHLPDILGDHDRDFVYAPLWQGGLSAISEIVTSDPFWAVRNIIDSYREQDEAVDALHACHICPEMFPSKPPGVIALNCYLPDQYIPGSPVSMRAEESLDEILGERPSENPERLAKTRARKRAK